MPRRRRPVRKRSCTQSSGMRALDAALARLNPEQRAVVLLREVEGLSYDEIAAALDIDEGTVKSRLARARAALAADYDRSSR